MRNQAQHHGVVPSVEEVEPWPTDVDRFVRGLMSASFGLELADVHSYLLIEDPRLRELLEEAELALDGGDAKRSFDDSWTALAEARRDWRRQRARFGSRIAPPRLGPLADTVSKELQAGLESVEEFVEIAAFATDFGEFVWFAAQHEEGQHRTAPSLDDARRALVFTVTWVSRWETFSARFPEKRWESWTHQPTPTVESDHDRPLIIDVSEAEARMADRHAYSFQLANVPAPDESQLYHVSWDGPFYVAYEEIHHEATGSPLEEVRAFIAPGGRLSLEVPRDAEISGEELLAFARRQIECTDEKFRALLKGRADRADAERELAKPYESVIAWWESKASRSPRSGLSLRRMSRETARPKIR